MTGMCPYCGRIVRVRRSWTASHHNQVESCPGSGQPPRNPESDGRPLWNGKPNPHQTHVG